MNMLQTPEIGFLVYVAVFLGFLLAFEGLRHLMSREEDSDRAMNRRMKVIKRGISTEDLRLQLIGANASAKDKSLKGRLGRLLRQSGLQIGIGRFLAGAAGLAIAAAFLLRTVMPLQAALAFGLVLGLVVPVVILMAVRAQRLEKLTRQLPDALDLMARGLEVGHPLSVTVGNVASDMSDPIGSEFGLIQDQVNYGEDIAAAFADFADRVDIEDVRYTSVSVGIQHGTGGNLAHVLRVLSKVIRDRAMMRKKIRAISAEGRLSATILSALPFLIIGVIHATSPTFYGDVKDDPLLLYFGAAVLTLIILQAIVLMRMVNFKF